MIIWVRHGFVSKNVVKTSIAGADFACISSEWLREEYIRRGWNPRIDYWITGFVPLDRMVNRDTRMVTLPDTFSTGTRTLLYAPTWNKFFSSMEMLGNGWIGSLRDRLPDLNIIIKPHPHIFRMFPGCISRWRTIADHYERVLLIEDPEANIYDYLPFADVLLSDASSVIFYYLALDRPMVLVNNPLRFQDKGAYDPEGHEWQWRDMGIQIERAEELNDAVVMSLERPEEKAKQRAIYRERIFGGIPDGKAAMRVADKLRALVNPELEDMDWVSAAWDTVTSRQKVSKKETVNSYIRTRLTGGGFFLGRYPRVKYIARKFLSIFE
jgi:CDP-glycerol glycerophosphotransferase (TagB/SpsB family)